MGFSYSGWLRTCNMKKIKIYPCATRVDLGIYKDGFKTAPLKRIHYPILLFILLLATHTGHAQSLDSAAAKVENLPSHFFASIQKKYSSLEKNLTRKTNHYLKKMQRQEKQLQQKAGK